MDTSPTITPTQLAKHYMDRSDQPDQGLTTQRQETDNLPTQPTAMPVPTPTPYRPEPKDRPADHRLPTILTMHHHHYGMHLPQ